MSICNLLASDREKKGKKNRTFNSLCWQHLTQVDSTCKRSVFQVQRLQRELSSFNGSSRGTDGPAASSQSPAAPSVLPVVPPAATPPGNNGWGWSNPRTDRQRGQPNENQNQTKTEQNQLKPTQTISCSQLESTKHCCGSQCIGLHFPSKSTVWLWVCTVAFVISRCVCVSVQSLLEKSRQSSLSTGFPSWYLVQRVSKDCVTRGRSRERNNSVWEW